MRTLARIALLFLVLVALACAKPAPGARGQLMVTIVTDLAPPKDFDAVRFVVRYAGAPRHEATYALEGAARITLPATFAIIAGSDPSAAVGIHVEALKGGAVLVQRDVVTTVPADRIAALVVPIEFLCASKTDPSGRDLCGAGSTCIGGRCEASSIDSAALPVFDPTLVFGGALEPSATARCFDVLGCFQGARAVVPDGACTVPLPADRGAGLNVALVNATGGAGVCASNACLVPLENDALRGWVESGGRIQLPAAACLGLGRAAIATRCATKRASDPPCGSWSSSGGPGTGGPLVTIDLGPGQADDGGTEAGADAAADASPVQDASLDGDATVMVDAGEDAAVVVDAGAGADGAGGADATSPVDAGSTIDAGASADASSPIDAGAPVDASPMQDASTVTDASVVQDATVAVDGDTLLDAAAPVDAGGPFDSGAPADAGTTDPCAMNNGGCSSFATCAAVASGRTCTCQAGFVGDGLTCANVNECTLNPTICGAAGTGTCTDTAGAYTCACTSGYALRNGVCADVDECATANGGCSANATCTNTLGSRTCACNAGFTGNGLTCAAVPACTVVSGTLAASTRWSASFSPYCVNANVVVPAGVTLTIDPGVVVRFAVGETLRVEGTLVAQGTDSSHIRMTCQGPTPSDPVPGNSGYAGCWGNVVFTATSAAGTVDAAGNYQSGSVLRFVDLEQGGYASTTRGVIEAYGRAPAILDSTIVDAHLAALYAEDVDNVVVARTTIRNTGFAPSTSGAGSGGVELQRSGATITDVTIDGSRSRLAGVRDIHDYAGGLSARNGGGNPFNDSGTETARITAKTLTVRNLTITGTNGPYAALSIAGTYAASLTGLAIRDNLGGDAVLLSNLACSGSAACVSIADSVVTGNKGGIEAFGSGTKQLFSLANSIVARNEQFQLFLRGTPARVAGSALGETPIVQATVVGGGTAEVLGGVVSASGSLTVFEGNRFTGSGYALFVPGTVPNQPFTSAGQASLVGLQPVLTHNTFESARSDDGLVVLGNSHRDGDVTNNLFRSIGALCNQVVGLGRAYPANQTPAFTGNNVVLGACGTARAATGSFTAIATGNYWGATTDAAVRAILVDRSDDPTLGTITYAPFLAVPSTSAPLLPPSGVTKATSGTGVRVAWSASTETDRAGYRVFWGTTDGFRWANSLVVGNVTSAIVPNVAVGERFAVAAYDAARSGLAFDDRVAGHESWPTEAVAP